MITCLQCAPGMMLNCVGQSRSGRWLQILNTVMNSVEHSDTYLLSRKPEKLALLLLFELFQNLFCTFDLDILLFHEPLCNYVYEFPLGASGGRHVSCM